MLPCWPDIYVVALGVHAFEPCGGLFNLGAAPFAVHHLAGLGFADSHLETLHAQRIYLLLDGFAGAVAPLICSATLCASSVIWFWMVGGASQSHDAVTAAAVTMPTSAASR